jgi:hypothetical protein
MFPAYPLVLSSSTADSTALANSTTATTILPKSALCSIPGGTLQVGSRLRIRLRGRISTVVTTPGTLTFDMRIGGVVVSAFGAIALNTTAQTNAAWEAELEAEIRSVGDGTTATALCTGRFTSRANVGSPAVAAGAVASALLPDTAPAVGTGFDSTAACKIDCFGTWSVANASNSIQVHQACVELMV